MDGSHRALPSLVEAASGELKLSTICQIDMGSTETVLMSGNNESSLGVAYASVGLLPASRVCPRWCEQIAWTAERRREPIWLGAVRFRVKPACRG